MRAMKRLHLRPCGSAVLVALMLAGCNLRMEAPTPTLAETAAPVSTVTDAPSAQPTLTPLFQATTQATLPAPPLPTFVTPTALPLGATSPAVIGTGGTVIPTVSTLEADQRYELQARPGKVVGINYTITLVTGSVTLTLQGAEGALWQKTFTASETGRAEVTVQQGGTYEIVAQIERFDGNYGLSWD